MQLYVSIYFYTALSKAVMPRNEASYFKVHYNVNGQILYIRLCNCVVLLPHGYSADCLWLVTMWFILRFFFKGIASYHGNNVNVSMSTKECLHVQLKKSQNIRK